MVLSKFPPRPRRAFPFRYRLLLATLSICAVGAAQNAPASIDRARMDEVLRSLNRGRSIGQVAVSPDGKRIAWVQERGEGSDIFVAPIEDLTRPEPVSAGVQPDRHCRENEIVWQPRAQALAFFSDCAQPGEQADLYLSTLDGAPARRLTELRG